MRISYRVFLVGGIPIAIAAAIAVAAIVLLAEADRARSGAVLAATIYRNLLAAGTARDDFLDAGPSRRTPAYDAFLTSAEAARTDLRRLAAVVAGTPYETEAEAVAAALAAHRDDMRRFVDATVRADGLVEAMAGRAAELIRLTDQARERQHRSNTEIVASLTASDGRLRQARMVVGAAQALGAAVAGVELARGAAGEESGFAFAQTQLTNVVNALSGSLREAGLDREVGELGALVARFTDAADGEHVASAKALLDWADRLATIRSAEERTLTEEAADLRTYSVRAGETEQATQTIAIETLKLSGRTADALDARDTSAARDILQGSAGLAGTVAALPISPLIQAEMADGIEAWRGSLRQTIDEIDEQSRVLAQMDAAAAGMTESARRLDEGLTGNATRISALLRRILVLGAAVGLFVGSLTGLAVARSITQPLKRLQRRMTELAEDSRAGAIDGVDRRDELGDMARATNVFITEIGRRERALRKSRDRADAALAELQKTQGDLIQAEKLASLGQLVAGIAHEINTPLGIALTTATLLADESRDFAGAAAGGRLQRSALERFVSRMREGTGMMTANLARAAGLVQSFKQVAADQASGERREFEMAAWLTDLLTSLSPVLRKTQHEVEIDCPNGILMNTYPGALGQVVTNLLTNAVVHAYDAGEGGRLSVRVSEPREGRVRIVFSDDGRGIAPENIGKVFDPFFTTGRSGGSTGLGLHIVYNLVTSTLGGRLNLYSKLGKGTRFTIEIPRVAGSYTQPDGAEPAALPPFDLSGSSRSKVQGASAA